MKKTTVKIIDTLGIHARPATSLVTEASKYESDAKVVFNEKEGNLKSIMGVMALGIKCGSEIELVFDGSDEETALLNVEAVMKKEGLI